MRCIWQDYTPGVPVIAAALVGGSRTQMILQQITNLSTKNAGQKVPMVSKQCTRELFYSFGILVLNEITHPSKN